MIVPARAAYDGTSFRTSQILRNTSAGLLMHDKI